MICCLYTPKLSCAFPICAKRGGYILYSINTNAYSIFFSFYCALLYRSSQVLWGCFFLTSLLKYNCFLDSERKFLSGGERRRLCRHGL